jgi:hypothetical protein
MDSKTKLHDVENPLIGTQILENKTKPAQFKTGLSLVMGY